MSLFLSSALLIVCGRLLYLYYILLVIKIKFLNGSVIVSSKASRNKIWKVRWKYYTYIYSVKTRLFSYIPISHNNLPTHIILTLEL